MTEFVWEILTDTNQFQLVSCLLWFKMTFDRPKNTVAHLLQPPCQPKNTSRLSICIHYDGTIFRSKRKYIHMLLANKIQQNLNNMYFCDQLNWKNPQVYSLQWLLAECLDRNWALKQIAATHTHLVASNNMHTTLTGRQAWYWAGQPGFTSWGGAGGGLNPFSMKWVKGEERTSRGMGGGVEA